jgi:hypothetical protein
MVSQPGVSSTDWQEANQRYLVAKLKVLGGVLAPESGQPGEAQRALEEATAAMPSPPALEGLAVAFGLSPFERDVLMMCAGVELDSSFAALCAAVQGAPRRTLPTFSLALATLPGAHWSALGPSSPLRRFHLIEVGTGDTLTQSPLRIDERVLHLLVGIDQPDERLMGLVERVTSPPVVAPFQERMAQRLIELWRQAAASDSGLLVELWSGDHQARRAIAASACALLGMRLEVLDASALMARADLERVGQLLVRERMLGGTGLLIEADGLGSAEPGRREALGRIIDQLPGPVLVSARDRPRLGRRLTVHLEVPRPTVEERRALWSEALAAARQQVGERAGADSDQALIEPLAALFDLDAPAIRAVCTAALTGRVPEHELRTTLWDGCRARTRPELEGLAERLEPAGTWTDLVLPEPALKQLRHMAASFWHQIRVHGTWGFSERSARGLGVGALFVGPSGTGKTLAAEVLAAELRLDLYRIDLSQVVSKYIGETEKNLRRIFEAAERGSALLLFDEADALFGRRGDVRSSQDRYANLEIAYLLQRMEAYRGLAILTTNLERSLDPAFLRRLRFLVRFPLPGTAERAMLWRRAFPSQTPTEGLDFERLAQLGLTGGNIRNIALRAAFLAAEADTPVRMEHVLEAVQAEYEKLGRTPGRSEGG